MTVVGRVMGGAFDEIIIRQAENYDIEIGDLLKTRHNILQVYDIQYAPSNNMNLWGMMAGSIQHMDDFIEREDTEYIICTVKALCDVQGGKVHKTKKLPKFLGEIHDVSDEDFGFLSGDPRNNLSLGMIRSGSKVLGVDVKLNAQDVFSHHVLIPATTGRGKSNLVKNILLNLLDSNDVGMLVLDAHNEYHTLNNHPKAGRNLKQYGKSLAISTQYIHPSQLRGIVELSDAQSDMVWELNSRHGRDWIARLFDESGDEGLDARVLRTRLVLRRKIGRALNIGRGETFTLDSGNTVHDIVGAIAAGEVVVIDTSTLDDKEELLIGSVLAYSILYHYRMAQREGRLHELPVASIILEEAPRVLNDMGEGNVFGTIAREGRKFKVGLVAITQLTSMIPRDILANLGTKIILGNEMIQERKAVIESAAQDLSKDMLNIAGLDKGEAIISSVFVPFAIPIKIPLFEMKPKPVDYKVIG